MRPLVDTNVLLAATFEELAGHAVGRVFLDRVLHGDRPWCLSWVNVYEYLRVSTHPRVFQRPLAWDEALAQVASLLAHPRVTLLQETDRHLDVFENVVQKAGGASGNFVHDCHIAALMNEHDVGRIVTADSHFRRFPGLEVLAPEECE